MQSLEKEYREGREVLPRKIPESWKGKFSTGKGRAMSEGASREVGSDPDSLPKKASCEDLEWKRTDGVPSERPCAGVWELHEPQPTPAPAHHPTLLSLWGSEDPASLLFPPFHFTVLISLHFLSASYNWLTGLFPLFPYRYSI